VLAVHARIVGLVRASEVRWPAVAVVAAAVAVLAWVSASLASWPPTPPESTLPAAAREAAATGTPDEAGREAVEEATSVLVVGDAFSAGTDQNDGPPWPELLADSLGWDVAVDAVAETGYLSSDGGRSFGERLGPAVVEAADIVVLAGGIADLGSPVEEIVEAAEEVLVRVQELSPDAVLVLVLVSPFSDGDPGPLTRAAAANLEELAAEHGVGYVDATDFLPDGAGLLGPDGRHPNQEGHAEIARLMEQALVDLGVLDP
jgi:lysophospholipase L1-like esterase